MGTLINIFRHGSIVAAMVTMLLVVSCSPDKPEELQRPVEEVEYIGQITNRVSYNKQSVISQFDLGGYATLAATMIPEREVEVESITYHTLDCRGDSVLCSGIVAYPKDMNIKGVVLGTHWTVMSNAECPTQTMFSLESVLAFFGYAVFSPDYLGFGATKEMVHPYLHTQSTGRTSVDMLLAGRQLMGRRGYTCSNELYVVGYSQGGGAALAFEKVAERDYADQIATKKVYAGGTPADLRQLYESIIKADYTTMPSSVPYVVLGINEGDNLGLDLSKIFGTELYANYAGYYYSKTMTSSQINAALGSKHPSNFMHPDLFTAQSNSEIDRLLVALDNNSLSDWKPRAPIALYHSADDRIVPYDNILSAYNKFLDAGANVSLRTLSGSHEDAALTFYASVVMALSN